jgi:hypothetical protein
MICFVIRFESMPTTLNLCQSLWSFPPARRRPSLLHFKFVNESCEFRFSKQYPNNILEIQYSFNQLPCISIWSNWIEKLDMWPMLTGCPDSADYSMMQCWDGCDCIITERVRVGFEVTDHGLQRDFMLWIVKASWYRVILKCWGINEWSWIWQHTYVELWIMDPAKEDVVPANSALNTRLCFSPSRIVRHKCILFRHWNSTAKTDFNHHGIEQDESHSCTFENETVFKICRGTSSPSVWIAVSELIK